MTKAPTLVLVLVLAVAMSMLAGCASVDYATFATKTSMSVVDGDTAPAGASIGFDRVEAYVGPRLADGTVYPAVAAVQSSGSGMSRSIQQTFAGGDAALRVLGKTPAARADATCDDQRQPPLVFGTTTNLGLKIGFADGTVVPNSFNLGYRRKEMAVVPVTLKCQPSVLSYAQNAPGVDPPPEAAGKPQLTLGLTQFFATGTAADALAENEVVQAGFRARAEAALTGVDAFNKREQVQGRLTLDIFECLESLDPARMRQVIGHGVTMQVFANDSAGNKTAGAEISGDAQTPDAARRKSYVEVMSVQVGQRGPANSRDLNLRSHREVVCALAGKS